MQAAAPPWGGGAKHETHGGTVRSLARAGWRTETCVGVRRGRGGPCGPPRCRKPLARFAGGGRGGQLAEADGGDVQDGRGCRGYALRFPPEGRQGHDGFPVFFGKGIDKGIQGRRGCRCVAANFRSVHVCRGSLFRYATRLAGTVPNMSHVYIQCVVRICSEGTRRTGANGGTGAVQHVAHVHKPVPARSRASALVLVVRGAGGVPRCRRCA